MNEKAGLGIVIAAFSAVSIFAALLDRGVIPLFPQIKHEHPQGMGTNATNEHQATQTASTQKSTAIIAQRDEPSVTEQRGNGAQDEKNGESWLDITLAVIQGLAAIVTAAATFVLARFASGQYRIYRSQLRIMGRQTKIANRQVGIASKQTELIDKQATIAHQSYIASHRGRIVVRSFLIMRLDAGADIQIRFIIANQGSTDAAILASFIMVVLLDSPGEVMGLPGPPMTSTWNLDDRLAGGDSTPYTHIEANVPLHPDDLSSIEAGIKHMHVLGMIAYQDDNGARRNTGFFRCYDVRRRRFFPIVDHDFEYQD